MAEETHDDWGAADDLHLARMLRARAVRALRQEMPALADAAIDLAERLGATTTHPEGVDRHVKVNDAGEAVATTFVPRESEVPRLDFSKPPPQWAIYDLEGAAYDEDLARAWAWHKARRDPPGMRTVWVPDDRCYPDHAGEWHIEVVTGGPALTAEFFVGDLHDSAGETKARAAAWAWYEDALEVADLLDGENGPAETWPERCAWPRPLTWTSEQRAEVRRWDNDYSIAALPEVLRG